MLPCGRRGTKHLFYSGITILPSVLDYVKFNITPTLSDILPPLTIPSIPSSVFYDHKPRYPRHRRDSVQCLGIESAGRLVHVWIGVSGPPSLPFTILSPRPFRNPPDPEGGKEIKKRKKEKEEG